MPLAPRIVRASRAICSASRTLFSLPRLTCSGRSRPSSFIRPRCSASSEPLFELDQHVRELALRELEPADRPAELLARLRVLERGLGSTHAPRPSTPQTMPNRASDRARQRTLQARARPGRTAAAGSRTSSNTSSDVTDARSESFRWMSFVREPRRRRRHDEPADVRRRSCAHTIATSAMPPFVIHIFEPFRIQSPPGRAGRTSASTRDRCRRPAR